MSTQTLPHGQIPFWIQVNGCLINLQRYNNCQVTYYLCISMHLLFKCALICSVGTDYHVEWSRLGQNVAITAASRADRLCCLRGNGMLAYIPSLPKLCHLKQFTPLPATPCSSLDNASNNAWPSPYAAFDYWNNPLNTHTHTHTGNCCSSQLFLNEVDVNKSTIFQVNIN